LVKNTDHTWWGTDVYGGPYIDRLEYIDYGTDPSAFVAAAEADEIDATYSIEGEFIDVFGTLDGRNENESATDGNQREPAQPACRSGRQEAICRCAGPSGDYDGR